MKLTIATVLLLSTFCTAKTHFDLELEKSKLSNKVFNHYDSDKSKTLSLEEFSLFSKEMKQKELEKRAAKTLKFCDKDKSGKIELREVPTREEMREMFEKHENTATMCPMDVRMFRFIDTDKNEYISKEEILLSYQKPEFGVGRMIAPRRDELKDFKEQLKTCDKNKDGKITLIEVTAEMCYMDSGIFLQYSPNPQKSFKIDAVTHTPKNDQKERIDHIFEKECDSNHDQQLTLVEATSKWCNITSNDFLRLDIDKNSLLSKIEFMKIYKEHTQTKGLPLKKMKNMPPDIKISIAFHQCDENKDGKLSKDETGTCGLPADLFEKYDYDASGTIEQNDMEMLQKKREFKMVDMNHDNAIDPKEFAERMGNRCRVF